jgi:hypothetical protein
VGAGDHVDDPRRRALAQQRQQRGGQGGGADEVDRQARLVAVGGLLPLGMRRAADVVHQHVKAAEAGQHLPGEGVVAADAGVVGGHDLGAF